MRKKAVPVGIEDFERIINEDYYYVDKTMLIEELLINRAPVTLFTRPRRFGKTLNMSMIKYFFDVKNKDENKTLFENLKISDSKYMSEQGKYPIIYISFKDLKSKNWEGSIFKLKNQLKDLYKEFLYLKDSLDEISQEDFNKIIYMKDNANYEYALKYLTEYLYKYYKQKVIVIIDEYDSPVVDSYENNYYDEAIMFFRNFYSSVLKDNQEFLNLFKQEIAKNPNGVNLSAEQIIDYTIQGLKIYSALLIALVIVALLATFLMKKRILSAILFLLLAIVVAVSTVGVLIPVYLFYFIVAIMLFVRKEKPEEYQETVNYL